MGKHKQQQQRAQRRHMRLQFGTRARLVKRRSQGLAVAPPAPRPPEGPLMRALREVTEQAFLDLARSSLRFIRSPTLSDARVRPAQYASFVSADFYPEFTENIGPPPTLTLEAMQRAYDKTMQAQ